MEKIKAKTNKRKSLFRDVDITGGRLIPAIIIYTIPLVITNLLQYLYNAADIAVVGNYASAQAVAAVGSTASTVSLVLNIVFGLATGCSILISRYVGADDSENIKKVINTAAALSILIGIFALALGELLAEQMLIITACPENIFDSAALYLRIYFLGMPAVSFYNYMACVLRAKGDSNRPLVYLTVSGLTNVVLNVILVSVFHMDVAGVAIATVVSQYLSAILLFARLLKLDGACRLVVSDIRMSAEMFVKIIRYGIPTTVANLAFCVSNVQVQTVINSYGDMAISGYTATSNLQSVFIGSFTSAFDVSASSFIGANIGAGDRKRTLRVIACMYIMCLLSTGLACVFGILFQDSLINILIPNAPIALGYAKITAIYSIGFGFLLGVIVVNNKVVQSFGFTVYQMVCSVASLCGFRVIWISFVYPLLDSFHGLLVVYPISWLLNIIAVLPCIIYCIVKYSHGKNFEL